MNGNFGRIQSNVSNLLKPWLSCVKRNLSHVEITSPNLGKKRRMKSSSSFSFSVVAEWETRVQCRTRCSSQGNQQLLQVITRSYKHECVRRVEWVDVWGHGRNQKTVVFSGGFRNSRKLESATDCNDFGFTTENRQCYRQIQNSLFSALSSGVAIFNHQIQPLRQQICTALDLWS